MSKQYKKKSEPEKENDNFVEKVIKINRVNKVVKGGKRLAFRAVVVVGDFNGQVGFGVGKSKEVPVAIKKAVTKARKNLKKIVITNGTIPHEVTAKFGAAKVFIKPAKSGTGVIAGGALKELLQVSGIKNVVSKTFGSNKINNLKAGMDALLSCRVKSHEETRRGVKLPVYEH